MATRKQRAAGKRLARAAKACAGKTKGKFKACMRKKLCKGRRKR